MKNDARGTFRLFGIPIKVQPAFLVITILLNAQVITRVELIVTWVLIVFTGVLAHELGHALAMRSFGHQPSILLHGFGGATMWNLGDENKVGQGARIIVSLAGPFTGIAISCVLALGAMVSGMDPFHLLKIALGAHAPGTSLGEIALGYALFVNGGWGVLNLLPIFPLDGGQVFASVADIVSPGRGRFTALIVSIALAGGLVVLSLYGASYWTALVAGMLAMQSWGALRSERIRVQERHVLPHLAEARSLLAKRSTKEAREIALRVQAECKTDVVRLAAIEIIAWSYAFEENYDESARVLSVVPEGQEIDPVLEGIVMLKKGEFEGGMARLTQAFDQAPSDGIGMMIVRAYLDAEQWAELDAFLATSKAAAVAPNHVHDAQKRAHDAGVFDVSVRIGERLFARSNSGITAYNVACSLSRLGKTKEALEWLARARDAGYGDRQMVDQDEDLAAVRRAEGWFDFRATLPFMHGAS